MRAQIPSQTKNQMKEQQNAIVRQAIAQTQIRHQMHHHIKQSRRHQIKQSMKNQSKLFLL